MYFMGVDLGSLSCDAVLVDEQGTMLASSVVPTGARNREAISRATQMVLNSVGISETDIRATVSTGYGRERVEERLEAVTEITCHARGIEEILTGTDVLIDIGGQDSKAIRLDGKGNVIDFAMNDKCAAGTGRFLEAMSRALQVDIEELSDLDRGASANLVLSSMCTVFAESEVVSLVADGTEINEIVSGLNKAIATRVAGLVKRIASNVNGLSVAMSGGVAHNRGVVRSLGSALNTDVTVPDKPDTVGALGAALIARDRFRNSA
jgi:predicted CoA-substrate-specific enzyme activase